jgi:phospholipid/cholesterol/gamma-HCH transport system permease protein
MMMSFLEDAVMVLVRIGAFVLGGLGAIGSLARFTARALGRAARPPYYPSRLLEQMLTIGYFSLPVVGLTALFTGAALA